MFRAVRGWVGSGRGQRTLRLFLFELTVVTLGVLIAQWVQGIAQDRSARIHMADERERARHELERTHLVAREWIVAVPCLEQRMTEIMTGRTPADHARLVRPTLMNPAYTPPDDQALVLIERKYGRKEKAILSGMTISVSMMRNLIAKIVDDWGRLALIDPANGPIAAGDRSEARLAAAEIKAQLHSALIISGDIDQRLATLGIGMSDDENLERGPAHSCAAIWRSGRMDPPLTTR